MAGVDFGREGIPNDREYAAEAFDSALAAGRYQRGRPALPSVAPPSMSFTPGRAPGEWQRGYTPNSKLASLTDANTNTTTLTYDGLDRLSLTSYPLGTTQGRTYDADRNILTQTTRAGEQVTFTYDTLNRVATKTANASGRSYSYAYSLINQPTSMTSPEGTWTFAYDNLRRMTTRGFPAIAGQAMSVSFAYDPTGNRLWVMPPDGSNDTLTYDALNRPVAVISSAGANPATVGYNQATLAWDTLGRLSTQSLGPTIPPATAPPSMLAFSYARPDAQVASIAETANAFSAQYAYAYDPTRRENGRVVTGNGSVAVPSGPGSVTVTANALNQISSQSYNANGNVLAGVQPGSGSPLAYTYDQEGLGQILTATTGGAAVATYQYAPDGTRWATITPSGTTYFLQDERGREIAEVDATGTVQRRLVYDGVHVAPFLVASAPNGSGVFGTVVYNHFDRLGSVIGTFDNGGNALGQFAYLPFGETPAPLTGTTFGYAGYRYDAETGLYHTGRRYYDAGSGRFLMPDPIGYAGGLHLYAYVGNDPLNLTDPSGLCSSLSGCASTLYNLLPSRNTMQGVSQIGLGLASIKGGSDLIGGGLALGGLSLVDGPASPATAATAAGAVTAGSGMVLAGGALISNGITILMNQNQGNTDTSPNSNDVNHVFGNPGHNLDPVAAEFGSPQQAYIALQKAVQNAVQERNIQGIFETEVQVGSRTVTVRGNAINGIAKIGTAFIP